MMTEEIARVWIFIGNLAADYLILWFALGVWYWWSGDKQNDSFGKRVQLSRRKK